MPSIPCPVVNRNCQCFGSEDLPVLNLSAEGVDLPVFVPDFVRFGGGGGPVWWAPACGTWVSSGISQEDAFQKAAVLATTCQPDDNGNCDPNVSICPGDGGGGGGGGDSFFSAQQECKVFCPGTNVETHYTLPAGAVVSGLSQADADARAKSLCQTLAIKDPLCFNNDLAVACKDIGYLFDLAPSGGVPPYNVTTLDGPPSGFVLYPDGKLSGTATTTGVLGTFHIFLEDSTPGTHRLAFAEVTLRAVDITSPTSLPPFTVGVPYSYTLLQAGGVAPLSWQIASGALPAGLTLNEATGVISGTPTSGATATFVIRLQDQAT